MFKAHFKQYLQTEGMDLSGYFGVRDGRGGGEVNLEQIFVPDRCGREIWGYEELMVRGGVVPGQAV